MSKEFQRRLLHLLPQKVSVACFASPMPAFICLNKINLSWLHWAVLQVVWENLWPFSDKQAAIELYKTIEKLQVKLYNSFSINLMRTREKLLKVRSFRKKVLEFWKFYRVLKRLYKFGVSKLAITHSFADANGCRKLERSFELLQTNSPCLPKYVYFIFISLLHLDYYFASWRRKFDHFFSFLLDTLKNNQSSSI